MAASLSRHAGSAALSAPGTRRVVAVLGMHRSGTSVVARSLGALGVRLGERLIPADPFNERGYWEDIDIVRLNEDALSALGRTWMDASPVSDSALEQLARTDLGRRAAALVEERLGSGAPFGMKDPRTAILLPFWRRVFRMSGVEESCVIVLRHPDLVAASLARRNGLPAAWSHWLWISHMLAAIKGSEGCRRTVVSYPSMIADPPREVRRIGVALGLDPSADALAEFVAEFVDTGLVRAAGAVDSAMAAQCPPLALRIHAALEEACIGSPQIPQVVVDQWCEEATGAAGLLNLMERRVRAAPKAGHQRLCNHAVHRQSRALSWQASVATARRLLLVCALALPLLWPLRAVRAIRMFLNTHGTQLIDRSWYLAEHPDARASGLGARLHFCLCGAFAGYAPNAWFRPDVYLAHRPHLAARR